MHRKKLFGTKIVVHVLKDSKNFHSILEEHKHLENYKVTILWWVGLLRCPRQLVTFHFQIQPMQLVKFKLSSKLCKILKSIIKWILKSRLKPICKILVVIWTIWLKLSTSRDQLYLTYRLFLILLGVGWPYRIIYVWCRKKSESHQE